MILARTTGRPARLAWIVVLPTTAITGVLAPTYPVYALAAAATAISLVLLAGGRRTTKLFLVALLALLSGYAFMGRGFAYLGVPPIYVGEIVLALGCFALVTALPTRRPGLVQLLIVAFMFWGAARTLPYLGTYGFDALRDGVAWAYAAFALFVSLLVTPAHLRSLLKIYGRLVPFFIAWVPIFVVVWFGLPQLLILVPGTGVAIPFFKAGDLAVHLAGAAAFILAGLYPGHGWRGLITPGIWALWLGGFAFISAINRSGMIAMATTSILLLFRRSFGHWATAILVGLFLIGLVGLTNVEIELPGQRNLSAAQLVDNIQSVLGESEDPALAGSRQWRQDWWDTILAYTVNGPYFWEGKGFGVNLANEDGFQTPDQLLRAPHSAHLNFLARGGVTGLILWLAVQIAFAVTMIRAAYNAGKTGRRRWLAVLGWIFVYWLAAIANMTFDVYLEGPQGGIVFWSIVGIGLATAACLKETDRVLDPAVSRSTDTNWLDTVPAAQNARLRHPRAVGDASPS